MAKLRIDWLSMTFPSDLVDGCRDRGLFDPWRLLGAVCLPVANLQPLEKGFHGWRQVVTLDGVGGTRLAYGGQHGTAFLDLSAQALEFYARSRGLDVVGLIEHAQGLGARITRLDLALDDFERRVTLPRILKARDAGGVVTRLKFNRPQGEGILDRDGAKPWTLYWGTRGGGGNLVRIYNKKAEREAKEGACAYDFWVRVEAELHRDKADQVARELSRRGWTGSVAGGVVRGLIDFREPQGANKSRWPLLSWWSDFLGDCEALKFGSPIETNRTVEDDFRYLVRQAARPFARAVEVYGLDVVASMLAEGRSRFTEADEAAIEHSKAQAAALPREQLQDLSPEEREAVRQAIDANHRREPIEALERGLEERDLLNQIYEALAAAGPGVAA